MTQRWGASPEEWTHFDLMLGLTADLLPVVSNPEAQISPESRMKGLGKTPSAYNRQGFVAGLKDWTDRQSTPAMVEKWSKQSDYGICCQTRLVRALDVDIPDQGLSARIVRRFIQELGLGLVQQAGAADVLLDAAGSPPWNETDVGGVGRIQLPTRYRQGTGKQLLAFVLPGDFRKRSFKVDGGLVEFLAHGQQFVALGTHPSGTRYEWAGGLPRDFPEIDAADFERAWSAIVEAFAVEPERRALVRTGSGNDVGVADDVASWLEANWETYGADGGKLYVACPWKDGHSSDSGETEASWMLAGTGGYAQGHFVCLHASCSGRTDKEFFAAVGRKPADKGDFSPVLAQAAVAEAAVSDPVALYLAAAAGLPAPAVKVSTKAKATAPHPAPSDILPLPGFERDGQGNILATLGNVAKALGHPQMTGIRLRYDAFRDELVLASIDAEDWRPFRDADAVKLRIVLAEKRFEEIGREMMRDALALVAVENEFDTAIHWLETVVPEWDGVERIGRFYPDYFRTDDTPYTRAVGEYVWTAHVGRVLEPGCQADMAPILIGAQGLLKSSGVMAMSPAEDFYKKFDLKERDENQSRKMRGVLVGEFDEMRGLNGRGAEEIRSFMTKRWEEWTPKFKEYETKFPRRMVFHGTGNEDEILNDPTGERRWLPMTVRGRVDVERIKADRLQLWAEGLALWTADGVRWAEAERLAKLEHGLFKVSDPWDQDVINWLSGEDVGGRTPLTKGNLRVADVLVGAVGRDIGSITKADEMRMAKVLISAGLQKVVTKLDGKTVKIWEKAK